MAISLKQRISNYLLQSIISIWAQITWKMKEFFCKALQIVSYRNRIKIQFSTISELHLYKNCSDMNKLINQIYFHDVYWSGRTTNWMESNRSDEMKLFDSKIEISTRWVFDGLNTIRISVFFDWLLLFCIIKLYLYFR